MAAISHRKAKVIERRIGCCRLVCGDAYQVLEQVDRKQFNTCASDPPYGINFDTDFTRIRKNGKVTGNRWPRIAGDDNQFDPKPLLGFKNVVLWGGNHFAQRLPRGGWLVWLKRKPEHFGPKFLADAELAWTNKGEGCWAHLHCWSGACRQTERGYHVHPTQKPVALMEWMLGRMKDVRGVFDPSTLR